MAFRQQCTGRHQRNSSLLDGGRSPRTLQQRRNDGLDKFGEHVWFIGVEKIPARFAAVMPEPTTPASRKAVPKHSATARRASDDITSGQYL
jgi:hypothetical protein